MHADFSKFCSCPDCRRYDRQEIKDALWGALVLLVGVGVLVVIGGVW